MLAEPKRAKEILARAIGCVVTKEEHRRLGPGEGWKRYQAAEIKVYDRLEMKWVEFSNLAIP
jgi:hypothetical protein